MISDGSKRNAEATRTAGYEAGEKWRALERIGTTKSRRVMSPRRMQSSASRRENEESIVVCDEKSHSEPCTEPTSASSSRPPSRTNRDASLLPARFHKPSVLGSSSHRVDFRHISRLCDLSRAHPPFLTSQERLPRVLRLLRLRVLSPEKLEQIQPELRVREGCVRGVRRGRRGGVEIEVRRGGEGEGGDGGQGSGAGGRGAGNDLLGRGGRGRSSRGRGDVDGWRGDDGGRSGRRGSRDPARLDHEGESNVFRRGSEVLFEELGVGERLTLEEKTLVRGRWRS